MLTRFADSASVRTVDAERGIALSTIEDYVRCIRAKYAGAGRHSVTKVDLPKRAIEDCSLPAPAVF